MAQSQITPIPDVTTHGDVEDVINGNATDAEARLTAAESALPNKLESTDIDTLAKINAILASETLIEDGDSRLTDARTPTAHNHDDLYYTETETDALLANKVDDSDARLTDARTPTAHAHDDLYYTEAETDALLGGKLGSTDIDTLAKINAILATETLIEDGDARLTDARTPTAHDHNDVYYTETETDALLANKVADNDARLTDARTPTAHAHDDLYYTEAEVDTALTGKSDTGHEHTLSEISNLGQNVLFSTSGSLTLNAAIATCAAVELVEDITTFSITNAFAGQSGLLVVGQDVTGLWTFASTYKIGGGDLANVAAVTGLTGSCEIGWYYDGVNYTLFVGASN